MKSPFLIALSAGVLSLLIAFAPVLWRMLDPPTTVSTAALGAPWQVDRPEPGQTRVFDLSLPGSTLAQARHRWGDELKLALMASPDGSVALEGYVERFEAGGVSGRLLLAFELAAQADTLRRWRDRLPGTPIEGGGRQHVLSDAAASELGAFALVGLSFIPLAQLDAGVLAARFGPPAERITADARLEHWLYPALGLAVVLDAKGRDVLQFVAPADFERRLAAPLRPAPQQR